MTDSTITPLGTILPNGWRLAPLATMCSKIGSGATPRGGSAVYLDAGITFIRSQNVFDHRFSESGLAFIDMEAADHLIGSQVQERDVLLNITGDGDTIARCCIAPAHLLPARVNQHVMIIRVDQQLIPEFLQRYLSHPLMRAHMLSFNSGGSRRALTKSLVESLWVIVPPMSVQRAISEMLGALDDKIAINDRIAATAEALSLALASDNMSHRLTRLDSLCRLSRTLIDPQVIPDPLVAHYSLPAFDERRTEEYIPPQTVKSVKFLISRPSVLLSKLNPEIPRVWSVNPARSMHALASTEFLVMEPNKGVSTHELWAVAAQPNFLRGLAARVTGTSKSHQRIRPGEVLAADVIDPRTLGAARERIEQLGLRTASARQQSRALSSLRDTLLPELLSGRLHVRDAERVVEDAV
jgi:type I restriction enzyme, S subunit